MAESKKNGAGPKDLGAQRSLNYVHVTASSDRIPTVAEDRRWTLVDAAGKAIKPTPEFSQWAKRKLHSMITAGAML